MNGHVRKAVIVLAAASMVGLVNCSGPSAAPPTTAPSPTTRTIQMSADYPSYDSLSDAEDAAKVIVKGKFLDSRVELLQPETSQNDGDELANPQRGVPSNEINPSEMGVVETISRVEVTESLKGGIMVGDIIEVQQPGGEHNQIEYSEESTVLLPDVSSSETLLFLNLMPDNRYDLINPEQGMYLVDGESLAQAKGKNSLGLSTMEQAREATSQ